MGKRKSSYAWTDQKTGYVYARVQVRDKAGKLKSIYRRATNLTHAEQLADEIKAEHESRGQAFLDGRKMDFRQVAAWYKEEFVIAPVYIDGKKIDGMRTWESERRKIDRICDEIGDVLINDLDEDVLRRFKRKRLKTVGIATVNRDFESIRRIVYKAIKKKWRKEALDFSELIDKSLESRRTVTITEADEAKILQAAHGFVGSPRLYALIVCLRDSGARPNELYPVNDYTSDYSTSETFYEPIRWRDVFADDGEAIRDVTVFVSYKGKKREARIGIVTERMKAALLELWQFLKKSKTIPAHAAEMNNLIFPHTTFQSGWEVVREKAGLTHVRLRDLRRDWVTRLARSGYSDKLAQRGAGHKTMQMSYEYTEFDLQAAMQAKAAIDAANEGIIESEVVQ